MMKSFNSRRGPVARESDGTIPVLLAAVLCALAVSPAEASTFRVPSEYPTIQAGLNVLSEGDTVLVAPGVYHGPGNYDLIPPAVDFVLRSEAGPESTVVDCDNGSGSDNGIWLWDVYTRATVIEGLSFVHATGSWAGGGITIYNASPTIRNCVSAWNYTPQVVVGVGGGIFCGGSSALIVNCTMTGNSSAENPDGSGIWIDGSSNVTIVNTVIWGNCDGDIRVQQGSSATLVCCVYGELAGGGQITLESCLRASPLFCSTGLCSPPYDPSRLHVHPASPCLPGNNACGVLIGALGVGCPVEAVPEIDAFGPGGPRLWATVFPNPTRGIFDCTVQGGTPPYRLELFDAAGRVVCSRTEEGARPGDGAGEGVGGSFGSGRITWNVAAGDCRVPSGVYRLRVVSDRQWVARSVLVLR